MGAQALREKRKLKEKFEAIGLVNRFNEAPLLINRLQVDECREFLLLNAKSIGIDQFESKKPAIEAAFGKKVESVKIGQDRRHVEITFNTKELPQWVSYQELVDKKLMEDGYFIVGESVSGVLRGKLSTFPHMLIAGTTGAGKSVFFKQTLLGLLKSTEHLQMYIVDLKKGLEASDFKNTPNIAIAKDPSEALLYLEKIQDEMNKRFKFLESKGHKSIEPKRDKKDLIVVAVDEAAELYAEKSRSDEDYEMFRRSQEITNSIARLGRAAGIHLILATQKVNKESINTSIQENISVRMCFRMNTLQGSLQVLGNKDALELSSIPGRGIFQHSNKQTEVQVPFVDGFGIQAACHEIAAEFQSGKRELFQPMLGKPTVDGTNEFREKFVDMDLK
ncbi:MAG: FtsK/SpoIIIE domain-containing protein [Bdellovibrionales bacterium]